MTRSDALSRKVVLLSTFRVQVTGFDTFTDLYVRDRDFGLIWTGIETCQPREYTYAF